MTTRSVTVLAVPTWTTAFETAGEPPMMLRRTFLCATPFGPILTPSKNPWIVTSSIVFPDPPRFTAAPDVGVEEPEFVQVKPWIPRVVTPLMATQTVVLLALNAVPVPKTRSEYGPEFCPLPATRKPVPTIWYRATRLA